MPSAAAQIGVPWGSARSMPEWKPPWQPLAEGSSPKLVQPKGWVWIPRVG